ncbi:MAG TPA: hypothetical protein VF510_17075 [Ktedonobacterales bacterium]
MSAEESIIASYQLDITVDHNQFFLEDCDYDQRLENLDITWSTDTWYDEDALARHLGVTPGTLCIFTARWYGEVQLEVIVRSNQPDDILTGWDNVAEASIEVPTGCVVVHAAEDDIDVSPRFALLPDTYRARVYAGGVETVDEYMQDGQDQYRVVLWPAPYAAPTLLYSAIDHPW